MIVDSKYLNPVLHMFELYGIISDSNIIFF